MAETRPNPRKQRAHSKGSDRKGGENNGDEPHEATKKRPEARLKQQKRKRHHGTQIRAAHREGEKKR
jgi:hypothetical protein